MSYAVPIIKGLEKRVKALESENAALRERNVLLSEFAIAAHLLERDDGESYSAVTDFYSSRKALEDAGFIFPWGAEHGIPLPGQEGER